MHDVLSTFFYFASRFRKCPHFQEFVFFFCEKSLPSFQTVFSTTGGPKHCPFSQTSSDCLSTAHDTRGSKVSAFLRDWQELDTEGAVFRARSTNGSLKERDLESKAVEIRLFRATLSCTVHKPAWKRATARCPGAETQTSRHRKLHQNTRDCDGNT